MNDNIMIKLLLEELRNLNGQITMVSLEAQRDNLFGDAWLMNYTERALILQRYYDTTRDKLLKILNKRVILKNRPHTIIY